MAAEGIVSYLITKLDSLITKEITLQGRLKKEVDELKKELRFISGFLGTCDSSREENELEKVVVKEVREIAYDIEDVLDEYTIHLEISAGDGSGRMRRAFPLSKWKARHDVADKIEKITKQLQRISERVNRYRGNQSGEGSISSQTTFHSLGLYDSYTTRGEDIVGIEEHVKKLEEMVIGGGSSFSMIAVVGMTGLGKTTLVKQVFERVKERFQCHAWIGVSPSCNISELLKRMVTKVLRYGDSIPGGDSSTGAELAKSLHNFLQGKRYLLVFDDVWDISLLDFIRNALPVDGCHSRILVTTRSLNANHCQVYQLETLPIQEAWNLFQTKVVRWDGENPLLQRLDDSCWEIVQGCGGLPLAVVEAANLVSNKLNTLKDLRKVLLSLQPSSLQLLTRILNQNFNELPYYLRSCVLHLGVFPEGESIKHMRLVRLWTAEGFVEEKHNMTIEEVAEDYLNQLVNNSVIQVDKRSENGRVRSYRVHSIMRDFIVSKSKEQNFCVVDIDERNEKIRRLSLWKSGNDDDCNSKLRSLCLQTDQIKSKLRSLYAFTNHKLLDSSSGKGFGSLFRLLRVLDLANVPLRDVPESVMDLIHLRYLNLEKTNIEEVPKSLGNLVKLETLNLKATRICEFSDQILKLRNLRHLLVSWYSAGSFDCIHAMKLPTGIRVLTSLQKLSYIEANGGNGIVTELGYLTQLRRLGVVNLRPEDGENMCGSISKMKNLHSLSIKSTSPDEILNLTHLSSPPQYLKSLYLGGRLGTLPDWISSLPLVRLTLSWSKLQSDPFAVLHCLSCLVELTLLEAYDGEGLYCKQYGKGTGFPELKSLNIIGLHRLNIIQVENGAMAKLQKMHICHCEQLLCVPIGIDRLRELEELDLFDMTDEFVNQIQIGGSYHESLKHIKNIKL